MLVANEKSVAALIRLANSWHQMKNNRAETTSKPQAVAYLQKKKGGKNTKKKQTKTHQITTI